MDDLRRLKHGCSIGWDKRVFLQADSCRLWTKSKREPWGLLFVDHTVQDLQAVTDLCTEQAGSLKARSVQLAAWRHMTPLSQPTFNWPSLLLLRPLHKCPSSRPGEPGPGQESRQTDPGRMRGAPSFLSDIVDYSLSRIFPRYWMKHKLFRLGRTRVFSQTALTWTAVLKHKR